MQRQVQALAEGLAHRHLDHQVNHLLNHQATGLVHHQVRVQADRRVEVQVNHLLPVQVNHLPLVLVNHQADHLLDLLVRAQVIRQVIVHLIYA